MTSPANILNLSQSLIQFPSSYDVLKAHYDACRASTEAAWMEEVKAANALKDSKTWRIHSPTWKVYCADFMPFADSTYRAYALSLPYAELAKSVTKTALTEYESRKLSKLLEDICQDETLIATTYGACFQATGKALPTEGELRETYERVERFHNQGVVTVAGQDVSSWDALELDIAESILELKQRQNEIIKVNSSTERKSIEIQAQDALIALLERLSVDDSKRPNMARNPQNFRIVWNEEKAGEL